ncbi:MAG TPA: immunoglobulin domain-containing protein [Opitutus sp.]|nr:immunoglobulin domain-containing protein [Opitutus sp.]
MENNIACVQPTLLKVLAFVFGQSAGPKACHRVRPGFWRACILAAGLVSSAHALQLTIAWDINSVGELGFNIERSQDGTNFVQVATVAAGVSSYTDLNLAVGTYWYRVRAFNSSAYSEYSNVASTETAASAPSFTTQPASQSVAAGANVAFSAVAAGSPVPTLQWKKNGVAISGATSNMLTLGSVDSADAATYSVVATNSAGSVTSVGAVLAVVSAPSFTSQPASQSVATGSSVSFSAVALGSPTPNLQWKKDGVAISGATSGALMLGNVSSADAATYSVVATNSAGSVTSIGAVLTVTAVTPVAPDPVPAPVEVASLSQLQNISARAVPGNGAQTIAMNFTVKGEDTAVLVRAIGPGLAAFTKVATFSDPKLALTDAGTTIASNDNWGGSAALASTFTQVGAFPLAANSKDAAILSTLSAKSYSAAISGKAGGLAMMEVYDADSIGGRIACVDVRAPVGTGEQRLIGGFTITGTKSLRVLIRARNLGQGGGKNAAIDPQLEIHRGSTLLARNDNWGGTAALKTSFELAGASSLVANSNDAAIDITLEPGTYTATVSGVNNSTGFAQLEIFEVQ